MRGRRTTTEHRLGGPRHICGQAVEYASVRFQVGRRQNAVLAWVVHSDDLWSHCA